MALDAFQQPTKDLLAVLGEQVSAARPDGATGSFLAFVDQAVQDVGQRARVYGSKRVVAMMVADWQPTRGDEFTVRGKAGKVEEIAENDGLIVTVVLNG
ncbi:hypothetical protein [Dyella sp.]|uniref:head-tail joining protein n=1 Tax=Dyella sp. TaxID=1869338 RepID=UPI00284082BE|nr:hypothetical protein [Dyella sp.]MDR3444703.1 hypothetical protein [Dyella sp.]